PDPPQLHEPVVNGREVTLSWDAATDDTTPPSALSYNVAVGDYYEEPPYWASKILSPMAMTDGTSGRFTAGVGNVGPRRFVTLKNVPRGVYVWGVQTLDAGLQPSY